MNNYKKLEAGRSMIEMLGVLAIIGVLSVGGIAGYSKAMNKFKTNKIADNVSMLVANIKTLYAQQNTYDGLNVQSAYSMGVVPDELVQKTYGTSEADKNTVKSVKLMNAFNGDVDIHVSGSTDATDKKAFVLAFSGISREACITLATNDWGSGYSSGLIAIRASGESSTGTGTDATGADRLAIDGVFIGDPGTKLSGNTDTTVKAAVATPGGKNLSVPMSVVEAAQSCSCTKGNTCSLQWKYY
ncbi:MAG: hypothetical protein MR350_06395 [Alphaproteobacteria bacterium]|nr:hypothetical protein [Alphaproteobacteria bacterium]